MTGPPRPPGAGRRRRSGSLLGSGSDGSGTREMSHLFWLAARLLRNRLAGAVAKVRHPRYAIAMAVAIAYFALLFLPQLMDRPDPDGMPRALADLVALGLAFWLLFWWVRGGYQEALAFDPAEVHQLFPAPFRRASLIRYKLLKAQAGVLATVVFLWIFGMGRLLPWYLALPGLWLMIETLHLHQVGASLVRVMARQGAAGLRRAAPPLLLIGAIAVTIGWSAASAFRALRSEPEVTAALAAAAAALQHPVPAVVLAPFRALLAPAVATTPAEWLRAVPVALLLLLAHYAWVVRLDAAFEEAAAEAGRQRQRVRESVRRGRGWWRVEKRDSAERRRWVRLPLRSTGEPAVALLWKQLTAFTGELRPTGLVLAILGLVVVFVFGMVVGGSARAGGFAVAGVSGAFAAMTLAFGPIVTRLDLRRDLEVVEVLRTFPVDARWLVLAELAAPTLVIVATYAAFLLLAAVATIAAGPAPGLLRPIIAAVFLAAALGPPLVALQVAVHNLVTLLFPDWVRVGPSHAAGLDSMGQSILTFLGAALLFIALLVPPLVIGGLTAASFGPALRQWAALPGALAALALLWLEVGLLARWLARLYEALDPAEAGLLR